MENLDSDVLLVDKNWKSDDKLIKVIGVGGGGCNAINHMFNEDIKGCQLIVCNTDSQSLKNSPVPTKIQLGEGLGAGTKPIKGKNAAIEASNYIKENILIPYTKMVFITAGLGGGTGTGAAPIIAKLSKDLDILTVAVVTLPFRGEGEEALTRAFDGLRELSKNVDCCIVIDNEKLLIKYSDLTLKEGFPKVNEVLSKAVKGIVEIIYKNGFINVDFEDVKTMLKNSKFAIIGCGEGKGENRIQDAVESAMKDPLLTDYNLEQTKNLLINVHCNEAHTKIKDLDQISKLIKNYTGSTIAEKRGIIYDADTEEDKIYINVIVSGFEMNIRNLFKDKNDNSLVLEPDFTFDPYQINDTEISSQNDDYQNIFYDTTYRYTSNENKPKFSFEDKPKPILCVELYDQIAELEEPAIQRKK